MSVEDAEEVVASSGEVVHVNSGIFHILSPSCLLDGLPFMWLTP